MVYADDQKLRSLCGYGLRAHVRYQDGRDSLAPTLVFADADYEVGDGTCGLHSDGKQANEPAIVYARADALIDIADRSRQLKEEIDDYKFFLEKSDECLIKVNKRVLELETELAEIDRMQSQIADLKEENELLKDALRYYANLPKDWEIKPSEHLTYGDCDIMKLYIAVLDDVPDFMVPTLVAHTMLGAHLKFSEKNVSPEYADWEHPDYMDWLNQSFKKCVVRVNQKEFDKISALPNCYLGHENTTLEGKKSCAIPIPYYNQDDIPNVLKFAKLWKPKG